MWNGDSNFRIYIKELIFLENNIVWFWTSLNVKSTDSSAEVHNILLYSRPFFSNFLHQLLEKSAYFKRNCESAWFVCFYGWLRRYQNIYPLTKYYYITERVYFTYSLFILFISTFSFLLFLYTVSWRYKRDYLYASIDILFKLCSILLTWWRIIRFFYTVFVLTVQKKSRSEPGPPSPLFIATPLKPY